jgi:hypothetical protein
MVRQNRRWAFLTNHTQSCAGHRPGTSGPGHQRQHTLHLDQPLRHPAEAGLALRALVDPAADSGHGRAAQLVIYGPVSKVAELYACLTARGDALFELCDALLCTSSEAADRWTWLVVAAYAQVRLARPLATDFGRPGEKPAEPKKRTPARVRRGFRTLHAKAGSPAGAPEPMPSDRQRFPTGWTGTTSTDPTPASAAKHQPAAAPTCPNSTSRFCESQSYVAPGRIVVNR